MALLERLCTEDFISLDHNKKVGNYFIGPVIGQGRCAVIKRGVHQLVQERVAVKESAKFLGRRGERQRKLWTREWRALKHLHHPNVVWLLETMETERFLYIILEYVPGCKLSELIRLRGRLGEDVSRVLMRQMVSALLHIHDMGIVHRDIKPDNIMVDKNMSLKIIDFGLSGMYSEEHALSSKCGTPIYAAPEIFSGAVYGPSVDAWSAGATLHHMVTGSPPFLPERSRNLLMLYAKLLQKYQAPTGFSAACSSLLMGLLHINPERRLTMGEVAKHPWMVDKDGGQNGVSSVSLFMASPLDAGSTVKVVASTYGLSEVELLQTLAEKKRDKVSAIYYLHAFKNKLLWRQYYN